MLIPIGLGITIGATAVAVTIASRPAAFRIVRSAVIDAPPEVLFALVNDFHHWAKWSPFEKLDPTMRKTIEGAALGVGSVYTWSGNSKAGEGKMTITDSTPHRRIALDLSFHKPMKAENKTEFTFEPVAGGTRVTWAMTGRNNFLAKAFALIVNVDNMVGVSFEQGLQALGKLATAS